MTEQSVWAWTRWRRQSKEHKPSSPPRPGRLESEVCRAISATSSLAAVTMMLAIREDAIRGAVLEEAAQIADGFTCGACGMDGKASAAIRRAMLTTAAGKEETMIDQKEHK